MQCYYGIKNFKHKGQRLNWGKLFGTFSINKTWNSRNVIFLYININLNIFQEKLRLFVLKVRIVSWCLATTLTNLILFTASRNNSVDVRPVHFLRLASQRIRQIKLLKFIFIVMHKMTKVSQFSELLEYRKFCCIVYISNSLHVSVEPHYKCLRAVGGGLGNTSTSYSIEKITKDI